MDWITLTGNRNEEAAVERARKAAKMRSSLPTGLTVREWYNNVMILLLRVLLLMHSWTDTSARTEHKRDSI